MRANTALTRRQAAAALGGALLAPSFASIGFAQTKTKTVRLGDVVATDNPEYAAHELFAKRFGELTRGEYEVKIFPNSVLGGHTVMNEQVRSGTLELAKSGQGFLTSYDKRLGVINLPFLYANSPKLFRALDGKLGKAYGDVIEQYGFKVLGFYDSGIRNVYNKKGPVRTPDDVKKLNLRLRSQPDKVMIATLNLIGAQAVPLQAGEVYNAISQGVVDGAENNINYYLTTKHNEVAQYYSKTRHFFGTDPFFASLKWYSDLTPTVQKALLQAGREATAFERKTSAAEERRSYERCPALGVKLNECDVEAFRRVALPVWNDFAGDLGSLFDVLKETQ